MTDMRRLLDQYSVSRMSFCCLLSYSSTEASLLCALGIWSQSIWAKDGSLCGSDQVEGAHRLARMKALGRSGPLGHCLTRRGAAVTMGGSLPADARQVDQSLRSTATKGDDPCSHAKTMS